MKTLIISDTHLDFPFEQSKLDFLKKIITGSDRVIINGDFWDGQQITFDSFVKSRWSELFPLLLAKKAVYIYGNHDLKKYADERVNLFSDKQHTRYKLKVKNKHLIFEHGNRLYRFVDEAPLKVLTPSGFIMKFIAFHIEKPLIKLLGPKIIKSAGKKYNDIIKKKIKKELKKNEIFVCGHTHSAEYSPDEQFINSGFMKYGIAQYILIHDDTITLKEEYYD